MNNTARIIGTVVCRTITPKAYRVTVEFLDGETFRADTVWLPKSICRDVELVDVDNGENDGTSYLEIRATIPAWFVSKLDNRPGWVRAGMRSAPMASRPW